MNYKLPFGILQHLRLIHWLRLLGYAIAFSKGYDEAKNLQRNNFVSDYPKQYHDIVNRGNGADSVYLPVGRMNATD